jgi:uncharacterized protein YneF (UPF0154 family)
MVEEIGIRILVPILLFFGVIFGGAYWLSDSAFQDVLKRRREEGGK